MGRPKKKIVESGDTATVPIEADVETKQRIISAAEKLFVNKGYNGVSMKDLAESVEVTAAALYYHFPNGKPELFIAVIKSTFEGWQQGIAKAVMPGTSIREKLVLMTLYFLTRPSEGLFMLMRDVKENYIDQNKHREIWQYYGQTFMHAISEVFQEAIDSGEITPIMPANTLGSMYHGMNMSFMHDPRYARCRTDRIEADRIANIVASVLLDGISATTRMELEKV